MRMDNSEKRYWGQIDSGNGQIPQKVDGIDGRVRFDADSDEETKEELRVPTPEVLDEIKGDRHIEFSKTRSPHCPSFRKSFVINGEYAQIPLLWGMWKGN